MELLVVIVIVAVLAALSITITRNLKQKAATTKCMNQMREWNTAIQGYAGDHNQQVLVYRWSMVGSTDSKAYNSYLSPSDTKSPLPDGEMGIALAYYRLCPAQWATEPDASRGYFMTIPNVMQSSGKYGKFPLIDSNSDGTIDSYLLSVISNPSEFLMMMDSTPEGSTPYRTSELNTFVKPLCINENPKKIRHSGQVHGMFADGHVETLNWMDINPDNSANSGRANRWFNMQ
jgi:prepilin-type processing-associated H-X9-DG protein